MPDTTGHIYPYDGNDGMTYRDWLIGQALTGAMAGKDDGHIIETVLHTVDALLAKMQAERVDAASQPPAACRSCGREFIIHLFDDVDICADCAKEAAQIYIR